MGRGVVAEEDACTTGCLTHLGRKQRQDLSLKDGQARMKRDCDTEGCKQPFPWKTLLCESTHHGASP